MRRVKANLFGDGLGGALVSGDGLGLDLLGLSAFSPGFEFLLLLGVIGFADFSLGGNAFQQFFFELGLASFTESSSLDYRELEVSQMKEYLAAWFGWKECFPHQQE